VSESDEREAADQAEFGRLLRALVDAADVEAEAAAVAALGAFHKRRAAEAERESLVAAFGGDPAVGPRVVDGPFSGVRFCPVGRSQELEVG
jgi:hypothetical protein